MRKLVTVCLTFLVACHLIGLDLHGAEEVGKKPAEAKDTVRKAEGAKKAAGKLAGTSAEAKKALQKKVEAVRRRLAKTAKDSAKKKTAATQAKKASPAPAAKRAAPKAAEAKKKPAKVVTAAPAAKKGATAKAAKTTKKRSPKAAGAPGKKGRAVLATPSRRTKKPAEKKKPRTKRPVRVKATKPVVAEAEAAKPAPKTIPGRAAKNAEAIAQLQKEFAELKSELVSLKAAVRGLAKATEAAAPRSVAAAEAEARAEPAAKAVTVTKTETVTVAKAEAKAVAPAPVKAPALECATLDLTKHFNSDGISSDANRRDADFDEFRQSYAAELLPEPGVISPLEDLPGLKFIFPEKKDEAKNNVAADGQRLEVPAGKFSKLYVLGSTTDGAQTGELKLAYEKAEKGVELKLSDWCAPAKFGERQALSMEHRHNWQFIDERAFCSMWVQTIAVDSTQSLKAVVLPENRKMHVFAMTLVK